MSIPAEVVDEGPSIYEAYVSCFESFLACSEQPHLASLTLVEDELGRFKVWAANIGASRDVSSLASLDARLKDSERTRGMVLLLLRVLRVNIDYATKIFDEPEDVLLGTRLPDGRDFNSIDVRLRQDSDLAHEPVDGSEDTSSTAYTTLERATILSIEALEAVHGIVSHLQRLSVAIRRASAREYSMKWARERDTKDGIDEGADDELCLKNIVKHRYPEADVEMQDRLGSAMSFRLRRFRFKKRRHDRQVQEQMRRREARRPPQIQQPYSRPAGSQVEARPTTTSTPATTSFEPSPASLRYHQPESAAPTFSSELFDPPKSTVSSVRSSETTLSVVGDLRVHWPPLPKDSRNQCPYCFDELEIEEVRDKRKWRKHLKVDLEPYNCFYPECQHYLKMFSTERDWLKHIMTKHAYVSWVCPVRSHGEPATFNTEDQFKAHMKERHKGAYPESQLATLTNRSRRTAKKDLFDGCILGCGPDAITTEPETGVDARKLNALARHIANHLLSLAMESLPVLNNPQDSETGGSDLDDSQESQERQKRPRSSAGLSEISIAGSWPEPAEEIVSGNTEPWLTEQLPSWNEASPSREAEWGFSIYTSYPPYLGPDTDPVLDPFRTRQWPDIATRPTGPIDQSWAEFYNLEKEDLENFSRKEVERQNVLHEIVQVESRFVDDLNVLHTLFRNDIAMAKPAVMRPERLSDFISQVFGAVDAIKDVHEHWLYPLLRDRQRTGPWIVGFSDIFREWIRRAKDAYITYATNYPNADLQVRSEMRTNAHFRAYVELPRKYRKLDLDSSLKSPIRHIQWSVHLLTNVLKYSTIENPETRNLSKVIDELKAVVHECGSRVAETTRNLNLRDLQNALSFRRETNINDLALNDPAREVLHKGNLVMILSKFSWREHYMILLDHYVILAITVPKSYGEVLTEAYDVSKPPIPMHLLVLLSRDDDPVSRPSVSAFKDQSAGMMYPFRIKHLGRTTYTLHAPSALARDNWCDAIISARSRYTATLQQRKTEPFHIHVLADSFFHYRGKLVHTEIDVVQNTPLGRGIRAAEELVDAEPTTQMIYKRVNCATKFRTYGGTGMLAIGTNSGLYISPLEFRGQWVHVLRSASVSDVTQIAALDEFGIFIMIEDRSLVVCNYAFSKSILREPPETLLISKARAQFSGIKREIGSFAIGKMERRSSIFYKRKGTMSSTVKVEIYSSLRLVRSAHTPQVAEIIHSEEAGYLGWNSPDFHDFHVGSVPNESSDLNLVSNTLIVLAPKTFTELGIIPSQARRFSYLKRYAPVFLPSFKARRPLGIFEINNEEALYVCEDGAIVTNWTDQSVSLTMEFAGRAQVAAFYGGHVVLFHDDFIEIRDVATGKLRQIINGTDVRCLDDGSSGDGTYSNQGTRSTIKVAMQHPFIEVAQLVFELLLNESMND